MAKYNWTNADWNKPDAEIASVVGCPVMAVTRTRTLQAARPHKERDWKVVDWEESDENIASKIGSTQEYVKQKRRSLGLVEAIAKRDALIASRDQLKLKLKKLKKLKFKKLKQIRKLKASKQKQHYFSANDWKKVNWNWNLESISKKMDCPIPTVRYWKGKFSKEEKVEKTVPSRKQDASGLVKPMTNVVSCAIVDCLGFDIDEICAKVQKRIPSFINSKSINVLVRKTLRGVNSFVRENVSHLVGDTKRLS